MTSPDWADMTPADWLQATPSELMERVVPGWGASSLGDLMRRTPSDWWSMMYPTLPGQAGRGARSSEYGPHHRGRRPGHHGGHHHHERECTDCPPDRCDCICCIGDVDIVVYARLDEQRIVPIVVENERRREKDITLELSSWTTRAGRTGVVETVSLDPPKFTLEPCGNQAVTLIIKVPGGQSDEPREDQQRVRERDVDSCEVVTADLRLIGCDHRVVRIAVAIVPRDCDPALIRCGYTCC